MHTIVIRGNDDLDLDGGMILWSANWFYNEPLEEWVQMGHVASQESWQDLASALSRLLGKTRLTAEQRAEDQPSLFE